MSPTIMSPPARSGRFAEDYLLWPHADVLAFNGTEFPHRRPAHRLSQRRLGQVRELLYVTAMNERQLLAFSQDHSPAI